MIYRGYQGFQDHQPCAQAIQNDRTPNASSNDFCIDPSLQSFWTIINFATDVLLLSAFALRIAGLSLDESKSEQAQQLHFKSFQVLSCVAPLIWVKLVSDCLCLL